MAGALKKSVALAAASLLIGLLTIEAGLRVAGYTPRKFHATARIIDPHWKLLLDCYPSNPRGYFDIDLRAPESRARYERLAPLRYESLRQRTPFAVESRYNSLRFRDREFGPKRRGVRRVMVVGDSFTEGQGVKEPDTYARVLERRLNAAEPGRFEVMNCGRRGDDFPALFDAFDTVSGSLAVAAPLVRGTKLRRESIAARIEDGFLDATTVMEALVARGVPMRSAHEAVGKLVRECEERECRLAELPDDVFAATLGGGELISVAMAGSLERLEEFLVAEYAPDLRSNVRIRETLRAEIVAFCSSRGRTLMVEPAAAPAA